MRESSTIAQAGATEPASDSISPASVAQATKRKRKSGFRREPLSPEAQGALLAACRDHVDRLLVVVLLDTGLRVSEFCGLTPDAVRWQRGSLLVRGKGDVVREVPLSQRARKLLEVQFAIAPSMPLRPRAVEYRVRALAEQAGLRQHVTPHVLRHSAAVAWMQSGVDIRAVQKALGHSRLAITETYLRYSDDLVLASFKRAWGTA